MKNMVSIRNICVSVLMAILTVCCLQDHSHAGGVVDIVDDVVGGVGDVVGGVGDVVGGVGDVIGGVGEAVGAVVGAVSLVAGVVDLSVGLVATLIGHTDCVLSTAFSLDGATLASGSCDFTIRLWDVATGTTTFILRHASLVSSTAFCPLDGCMLTSGTEDGKIHLWNPDTGKLNTTLTGHTASVLSTAFHPFQGVFASGSADSTIRLWDAKTGAHLQTFSGHADSVLSIAFHPAGALLASSSADATIRLWDARTGILQRILARHRGPVGSAAFSPDGAVLATCSADSTVRLWDPATGEILATLDHHSPVLSVAFSPAGDLLASGSSDGTVNLWDPLTRRLKGALGHGSPVMSVAFSPDGGLLAGGTEEGLVLQWQLSPKNTRLPSEDFNTLNAAGNEHPVGIWSDGTTMWVADLVDGKIYAYDMNTKARVTEKDFNTLEAAGNRYPRSLWSDAAAMWVADEGENKIFAYDMDTKARVIEKDFNTLEAAGNLRPRGLWSDGTTMWVADDSGSKIYAYDMDTKSRVPAKEINTLEAAGNYTPRGLWSDGTTMWVADFSDEKIYAYDMNTKARVTAKEINTLKAAGNRYPQGIWSDGTAIWVADDSDDKLYAFNIAFGPSYDSPCAKGGVVPNAAGNPRLVSDCETLLAVGDSLAGTGTLNWSDTSIATWDGVTIGGTPPRVTRLELPNRGLTGTLSPELGRLIDLKSLKLSANKLSGTIPAELGGLPNLKSLSLSRNQLTGCIPAGLRDVPENDLKKLRLPNCGQAQKMMGLPVETQLLQNAPNPFNSETVISWFLLEAGSGAGGGVCPYRTAAGGPGPRAATGRPPSPSLGWPRRRGPAPGQRGLPVPPGDGGKCVDPQAHPSAVMDRCARIRLLAAGHSSKPKALEDNPMKTPVLYPAFWGLLALMLSPAAANAFPSPADSVHFCQVIDPEEWEREQPLPAAKRTALNAGESRIVRLFYFLPNDRPYRAHVVEAMKTGILEVQSFYREQMAAHGYGNKTFQIETDAQGVPVVHRVNGDRSDSHYKNRGRPENEISRAFDTSSIVQLIVMDISRSSGGIGVGLKQRGMGIVYGGWTMVYCSP